VLTVLTALQRGAFGDLGRPRRVMLAAHPLPLWLAGEPEPTTAEAAAYAAFGRPVWIMRHDGPAETAPLAAADWLIKP
jgi:hypothetical protein